jgi:mono/diheme cytochrome c family protein
MKPIVTIALFVGLVTTTFANAQSVSSGRSADSNDDVSAVSGVSWIHHLNRRFEDTAMGKTGQLGPAPGQPAGPDDPELVLVFDSPIRLTGADLYRLNCRGCHGESGQGVPPEINSIINPVRATSVPLVLQRMKNTGMEISQSAATQMSREAAMALLKRLHQGGENMPSFSYLNEVEISAIIGYLKQLSGVPGSESRQLVKESPLRVGELVVKSTCHICHDATGANPAPQEMLAGAIPPIETLPRRADEPKFIRKVTQGSVIAMGADPIPYRGRMPVFYYLTEQEAADAYLYLHRYPPEQSKKADFYLAASQKQSGGPGDGNGTADGGTIPIRPQPPKDNGDNNLFAAAVLVGLYGFVTLMIAGGVAFTFREFKRLSRQTHIEENRPSRFEPSEIASLAGARSAR